MRDERFWNRDFHPYSLHDLQVAIRNSLVGDDNVISQKGIAIKPFSRAWSSSTVLYDKVVS
jgi:hypothetical protein